MKSCLLAGLNSVAVPLMLHDFHVGQEYKDQDFVCVFGAKGQQAVEDRAHDERSGAYRLYSDAKILDLLAGPTI